MKILRDSTAFKLLRRMSITYARADAAIDAYYYSTVDRRRTLREYSTSPLQMTLEVYSRRMWLLNFFKNGR